MNNPGMAIRQNFLDTAVGSRWGSRVALALLTATAVVIIVSAVGELALRAAPGRPESVVRRYFAALEAGDIDGALTEVVPSGRAASRAFVENVVGNEYRITGIAVRHGPKGGGPRDVTIFLDITQAADGARWQAGPRVPLVEMDGRWFLASPPLWAPP